MPNTEFRPGISTNLEQAETKTTQTTPLWDPDAEITTRPFTYRHAWEYQGRGVVTLILHGFFGVTRDWQVYVFASSADVAENPGDRPRAAARFRTTGVTVSDGHVVVTVLVDKEVERGLVTDFLIVPANT